MINLLAQTETTSIVVAGIAALATVIVASFGIVSVLIQGRRNHVTLTENASRIKKIEHGINHIDEEPDPLGPPLTLGQLVKQGFATNQEEHGILVEGQHIIGGEQERVAAQLVEHTAVDERIESKVDGVLEMRRADDSKGKWTREDGTK